MLNTTLTYKYSRGEYSIIITIIDCNIIGCIKYADYYKRCVKNYEEMYVTNNNVQ